MTRSQWTKSSSDTTCADVVNKNTKKKNKKKNIIVTTTIAQTADKHAYYHRAVQAPKQEITTLLNFYREINASRQQDTTTNDKDTADDILDGVAREPNVLREDFCGTAILCSEWVGRSATKEAYGVDIDASVIAYSREQMMPNVDGSDRIRLVVGDVLKVDSEAEKIPKCDILAALNYGIFYFKSRSLLVKYFQKCKEALDTRGILVCDMFGGSQCYAGGKKTVRKYDDFTYYFEQKSFDILTNTAKCYLHFQFKDGKVVSRSWMKNAFSYDFRVYTILEVREAMKEAGFAKTIVWWTETQKKKQETSTESAEQDDPEDAQDEEDENCLDQDDGVYYYEKISDGTRLEGCFAWNAYVVGII